MKKLLITGASGFVGGFLAEEASARDFEVHCAVRKTSDTSVLDQLDVKLVYLDFEDVEGMTHLLREGRYDYIIHNAGLTKSKSADAYYRVNDQYLRHLIAAIRKADLQLDKFLFVSSLAAYGPVDHQPDRLVSESSVPHPVTHYGRSKLAAEQYLKAQEDIPYIIIRPTAVYGPREYDLLTVYQTIAKSLELYVGLGQQRLTFVYVRDLVRVMMDVLLSDLEYRSYFVTDDQSYTAPEMNQLVKSALGQKWTIPIRLPIFVVKLIAHASEFLAGLSGKYPTLNVEKVNELKARDWSCDIKALQSDVGYAPQYDLNKGLQETIKWCRKENLL